MLEEYRTALQIPWGDSFIFNLGSTPNKNQSL